MNNPMELQVRRFALGLSALLALQLVWGGARLALQSDPEPIAPAITSLQLEAASAQADGSEERTQDFVSRPLFWPGREAFVVSEKQVAQQEKTPEKAAVFPGLKLVGVYSAGPNSGIIVFHKGTRKRLRIGEELDGWSFSMMSADGAVFESGDEVRAMNLEHALPPPKAKKPEPGARLRVLETAEKAAQSAAEASRGKEDKEDADKEKGE